MYFLDTDMRDLLTATISETRWVVLGVALNVEQHQLKRIKSTNRDPQECQNDMIYVDFIRKCHMEWTS